ncbi:MAG: hypothetical protein KKH01_08275 [Firmicutes bacterium]|nr:hypothetical protein [Bacillota bacterium]
MADLYGRTYEFVTKAELKSAKEEVDSIIRKLQKSMRPEGVTFIPNLVGSAGRNLVTKEVGGNKGFDFDYNFSIQKMPDIDLKSLKHLFINKLNAILSTTNFKSVENNTQAMTIKVVDTSKSKIVHSCDFAIVNDYIDLLEDSYQDILIYNKQNNTYIWNKRPNGKNYGFKVSNILANGLWGELKEEYLKLKNNNRDPEKKSFSLYFEAISNVYNRYDWS